MRSEDGRFPVILESFDPDRERHKKISGLSAFRIALLDVFLSPQTRRIVKLLAEEANSVCVPTTPVRPKRAKVEARPIALGRVVRSGPDELSHVSIFGVSGFISRREVEKFLMAPDSEGSAIQMLNDKFVVAFSFVDSCRVSVSEVELRVLQAESRKAISEQVS